MDRPVLHWRARLAALAAAGALLVGLFPMAGTALAAVSITPATGGAAISADTAVGAPRGTTAWTSLSGPAVVEGLAGDIPNSGTVTLTLTGGWEFRTTALGGAVAATFSASAGSCALTATTPVITATTIATTLGGTATTGSDRCRLTLSGIQVRPTIGTPLPNAGTLTFSGAVSGAAGALAMVAGAPVLTFTLQPSTTASGGVPFAQQAKVKSADQFGNERVGDVVTLAINTATVVGTLTCSPATNQATTVDVAGEAIATFAGCALDKAGSYTLRATAPGQAGAIPVTGTITVSIGAAAKLIFYQRPAVGVVNVAFPAQPIVAVADAGGNIVPSGNWTIALAIGTNPGSGTLSCSPGSGTSVSTQITAIGVAATFSGCKINNAGIGYTLTASTGGLTSATTPAFDVENLLVFSTQPAGAIGGAVFTTQPVVAVRANAANAINDSSTVVTLAIRPGTGAVGATLTCTGGLSKTVVAGVATFSGCAIDKISPTGNPYQLVASTSTGLSPVNSTTFAVTVGPATKLAFTTQPTNVSVAQSFPVSPVVTIQDVGGNTVTTGAAATAFVTLAILSNPGGGTLTCTGGLSKAAIAGVATFAGCSIDRAGVGYTLTATSTGLTSATSNAFNVTAPAAVISLVRSAGMVAYGQSVGFTIQFATNGAGRTFTIEHTYVGSAWTPIATLSTNAYGTGSFTFSPTRTGYYRVNFAGTTDLSAAFSNVVLVGTRQTVNLFPTHSGVLTIVRGRTITFRSTVRPLRADLLPSQVTFRFYRKVGDSWVLRYERHVSTDAAGVARTAFRFGVGGYWYVRAFAPRTPYNSISRYTQREVFRVL